MLRIGLLTAIVLFAFLSPVPVRAEEEHRTIGGRRVDIRVRERDRMRREYEEMKQARAAKLKKVREETAGYGGTGVRGWRGDGYGRIAAPLPRPEPAPAPAPDSGGVRPIEGTPKYLLYTAVVALGAVIVVRFRRNRRLVTSSRSAP